MIKLLVFCFLLCFWITDAKSETSIASDPGAERPDPESDGQWFRLARQKDVLHDLLADIEKRYGQTAATLKKLHGEIERKRHGLTKIRSQMAILRTEIEKQRKELAEQIKSAYAMGQKEQLKLILNQQDPGLSSRMMIYYSYLNKARIAKLAEINESIKRQDRLEQEKLQETAVLEKNLEQKKSEQIILDGVRQQRNELLAKINDNSSTHAEQLSLLSESETKLKKLIASLQSPEELTTEFSEEPETPDESAESQISVEPETVTAQNKKNFPNAKVDFFGLKGKLPWPVKGRLVQKFGSPRSDTVWDGVLIDAEEGADIHAVTWGKVVYAEWLRGYGLLIIIDHGQDYMTLYAFNQSLYKQAGELVQTGEVIASVGQSGGRSQPGLYFGIRRKATPLDPLDWCRK